MKVKNNAFLDAIYVLRIIIREMPSFFLTVILMVLSKAMYQLWSVSIPMQILSLVQEKGTPEQMLLRLIWIAGVLLGLRMIASWSGSRYEAQIGLLRTNSFRAMMIEKMMRIRYSVYEEPETRSLTEKAWYAAWSNNWGIEGFLRNVAGVLSDVVTLVGFIGLLTKLNVVLPAVLLVVSTANFLLVRHNEMIRLQMQDEKLEADRKLEYISEVMQDMTYGKDIRISGMGSFLFKWAEQMMGQKKQILLQEHRRLMPADFVQILITMLRDLFIYAYLSFTVWFQGETVANFTLYFNISVNFSTTLAAILSGVQSMLTNLRYVSAVREMMALEEETDHRSELDLTELFKKHGITFEHVCYRYPGADVDAVHDFSYTFQPSACVALVGENGCGKTTLVKLLCGLLTPTSGQIRIGGMDVTKISGSERYALFSAVFQDINQYAFTVGENIACREAYDGQAVNAALAKTELTLEMLPQGLDTLLRKDFNPEGTDLSGGQLQALSIARALFFKRPFVIMDEPTAALDPIAEDKVYQQLAEVMKDRGSLFISHRLASTRFCDDIIVMREGNIVQNGTHAELMKESGFYAELFEAQSVYYKQ